MGRIVTGQENCFDIFSASGVGVSCLHVQGAYTCPPKNNQFYIGKSENMINIIYIYYKHFFTKSSFIAEGLLILAWQFCNSTDLPSGSITFQMKTTTHFWPENLEIQVFSFLRRTFWDKRNQGDSDFDMFLELARSIHVDTSG